MYRRRCTSHAQALAATDKNKRGEEHTPRSRVLHACMHACAPPLSFPHHTFFPLSLVCTVYLGLAEAPAKKSKSRAVQFRHVRFNKM